MKNRDIIIIGIQAWDIEIGSNCKNIAEVMSHNNRVLYVNTPLDRKTRWAERTTQKVQKRIRVLRGKENAVEMISPGLWVLNPATILESINMIPDGKAFDLLNRINNKRFAHEIKKAALMLGFKDYILFNDSSMFLGFYQKELLMPAHYIYYMRDNLMQVPFWRKHGLRLEPDLISKADVIVNNSLLFTEYGKKFNDHSYMVGQGCDIDAYNNDIHEFEIPEELRSLKKPIIGYVGFLSTLRLNIRLIEELARARADWTIVLVGPEDNDFKASVLHQLANVIFTGPRKPEGLPAYINSFDICINPQIINDLTMGNYPRKIDEYLSMGKPVIASTTAAMDYFADHVYLGATADDYISLIEKALKENSASKIQKRKSFARSHTWENNVNEIFKSLEMIKK
jgi:glycosyltransferase involved in cell wall biosynthesis